MKLPSKLEVFFLAISVPILDWIYLYFSPGLVHQPVLRFSAIAATLFAIYVPVFEGKKERK